MHLGKSTINKETTPVEAEKPKEEALKEPPAGMAFGGLGGLGGLGGFPGMGAGGMPDPSKMQEVMNNPQVQ